MMRATTGGVLILLVASAAASEDKPTAAAAYEALTKEYAAWEQAYAKLARAAKTDEDREKLYETRFAREHPPFVRRFLELAEQHPKDPISLEAFRWVLANDYGGADGPAVRTRVIALLTANHIASPALDSVFDNLVSLPSPAAEAFFRTVLEKSPHRVIQGRAGFALGRYLMNQAEVIRQLKLRPELAKNVEPYCGAELVKQLIAADPDKVAAQADTAFSRVAEQYPLVKNGATTLGEQVKGELFELRHLAHGKVAPEIEGDDVEGRKLKLSDYRGKVVVLTFWGDW